MIRHVLLLFSLGIILKAGAQQKAEQISLRQNLYEDDWLIKAVAQKVSGYS